jgi:hypothetical protein
LAALLLAGAMLAAGAVSVVIGGRPATDAQAAGEYTIEILASGFNPQTCIVNRNNSTVSFLNKDTKVRRVIQPAFSSDPSAPPEWDSGDIQPGAIVRAWVITGQAEIDYEDANIPSHTGVIIAPQDPNAASDCDPNPPTPTPTNTPTITPTPTRTATPIPTPSAPPMPEACDRFLANPIGCLVAIWVATDGPLE